jgi:hypothetical protein
MSRVTRIAAGVALATVMGLSIVAAQDVPPPSRSLQLEAARAVEVEVLDAHRKGIPNTRVSLTDLDRGSGVKSGITDSNGLVLFRDVPDGEYRLNISGPGIEDPGSVGYVAPGAHRWQAWLPVIDGKAVKMHFTPCDTCGGPGPTLMQYSPVPTTISSLKDRLSLPPLPSPLPPRRNLVVRVFSSIGHKLRFS